MRTSQTCKHDEHGFTILEILVVLIIASLTSVILMQGLTLILNLRNNFSDVIVDLDQELVKRNLLRQPLEGLVPDFNDGDSIFSGTAQTIKGLTIQPLLRRPGRPIPFGLRLQYDQGETENTLYYQEDRDAPLVLAKWPGAEAHFRFIGDATGWSETWPPEETGNFGSAQIITDVKPPQLPELVYLETQSAQELDVGVSILTRRIRTPRDPVFSSTTN